MPSREPDLNGELNRQPNRKPDITWGGRGGDTRNGETALAREFARRALAPIVANLHNKQGRLDPGRVASAVGMKVEQLAACLQLPEETLRASPLPEELEDRLEPFAMVIAIVRDSYGGDDKRVRTWLKTPRPELEGQTPNEALCVPGGIDTVVTFVLSAWLGNAD